MMPCVAFYPWYGVQVGVATERRVITQRSAKVVGEGRGGGRGGRVVAAEIHRTYFLESALVGLVV